MGILFIKKLRSFQILPSHVTKHAMHQKWEIMQHLQISDQLQTERKHTYLRQDSQMDLKIPIISEVSPASSPYIRYDDPTYDSVSCTPTTDLNSRSSSNIHGFAIYRHGQTLPQIPQRVLGSHKGCRKNALYECNQTNSIDRQFVSKCSLVIIVAMWVVAMTMAIYSLCMFRDLQSKYSDLQEQLKSTHISLAQTQEESLTCLPCAGLKLGPLPEETKELDLLIQKEEHGIRICCAKTSAQMFVMMNLVSISSVLTHIPNIKHSTHKHILYVTT